MNASVYSYEDNSAKKVSVRLCSVYVEANSYMLNHLLTDAPSWFLLTGNL